MTSMMKSDTSVDEITIESDSGDPEDEVRMRGEMREGETKTEETIMVSSVRCLVEMWE